MSINITELKESKLDFNELLRMANCNKEMMIILKGIAHNQNMITKILGCLLRSTKRIIILEKKVDRIKRLSMLEKKHS